MFITVPTSVGGNNHILITVNEKSDFVVGISIPTKSTTQLIKAADVITGMYGHTISYFTSDNEINLRAMETQLRTRQISISTFSDGLHERNRSEASKLLRAKAKPIHRFWKRKPTTQSYDFAILYLPPTLVP